ncbi:MAG: hypothetical protein RL208_457 [Pseudomonadota bacterium]|jgi:hypothetical protein
MKKKEVITKTKCAKKEECTVKKYKKTQCKSASSIQLEEENAKIIPFIIAKKEGKSSSS